MIEMAMATYVSFARPENENVFSSIMERRPPTLLHQPRSPWTMTDQVVHATSEANAPFAVARPAPASEAQARLTRFRHWGPNWDNDGAAAPDMEAIESAVSLLALIEEAGKAVAVHLDANGRPVFFLRDSDWRGEIVVEDRRHLSFEFERGDVLFDDYGVEFGNRSLPEALQTAIAKL